VLIRDSLREQGELLFRLRSSLPLILLPVAALALRDSEWLERSYGDVVDDCYDWLCVAISGVGLALRIAVAGCVPKRTSGRNTRKGQVADTLNTTGLYSVVRHPLYLANGAVFAGLLLATASPWFVLAGALAFLLYYERIAYSEEEFLLARFGARYRAWAAATPALVPRLSAWQPPELPFCWRTAVKREYQTVCTAIVAFAVLDYAEDALALGRVEFEAETTLLLALGALLFVGIRLVRTQTRWLRVPGR
jgi:protein-S-isoprenylcysteine O-methyltransferase Ste14